jgi:hypothetical protein
MQKDDPLFGRIEFRRNFGFIGAGFWQGRINFPPVGKSVGIYLSAGRSGIDESHRDFYRELEQRYDQMIPSIFSVLDDLPGSDHFIDRFGKPEWKDFDLDSIFIPKLTHSEPEWTLSYRYLPGDQIYHVYLEGWKPTHGDFDD